MNSIQGRTYPELAFASLFAAINFLASAPSLARDHYLVLDGYRGNQMNRTVLSKGSIKEGLSIGLFGTKDCLALFARMQEFTLGQYYKQGG